MNFLDRRDDLRVGAAAADIAAHALAYLVVREPRRRCGHVLCHVTHVAAPRLVEQADGGTNLSGRAVPALKGVVSDEGGLHRVESIASCQPLDRRDFPAL